MKIPIRCTDTNRTLQETLAACLKANGELKARIGLLETALHKSSADRDQDREIYRKNASELMKTLAESKRERDIYRRDREVEVQRRIFEVEKHYVELLNRRQAEWEERNEDIQSQLETEIMTVTKLTRQVEKYFEECSGLRNKLRESQAKHSQKESAYRDELNALRNSKETLEAAIVTLKTEVSRQRTHCDNQKRRLRDQADRIKGQLAAKIDSLTNENESLKRANSVLNNAVAFMKCKNEKEKLTMHIDETRIEDGRIGGGNMRTAKTPSGVDAADKINCRISEHKRYPLLVKQNEVLQEIVKTMRKERETLRLKQREELRQAEVRVEKLENVIDSMKRVVVSNVEIPNGNPVRLQDEMEGVNTQILGRT